MSSGNYQDIWPRITWVVSLDLSIIPYTRQMMGDIATVAGKTWQDKHDPFAVCKCHVSVVMQCNGTQAWHCLFTFWISVSYSALIMYWTFNPKTTLTPNMTLYPQNITKSRGLVHNCNQGYNENRNCISACIQNIPQWFGLLWFVLFNDTWSQ